MVKAMRAECYKAFHRSYFHILTAVCGLCALLAVLCLYWIKVGAPGPNPVNLPFALTILPLAMPVGLYMVAVGADLVFSEQYKHGTLKNEVSYGVPRAVSYLSRWAVAAVMLAVVLFVMLAVYLLAGAVLLGLPTEQEALTMYGTGTGAAVLGTLRAVVFYLLASLPLWLGALSLVMLCFFLINSSNAAAIGFFCVMFGLPMILDKLGQYVNPLFTGLYRLTLNYAMSLISTQGVTWPLLGRCWLTGLAWTAVLTALGLLSFSRREIK